jgi:ribosome-associated toxin RatA of RatAB toxin-antitoxin module
LKTVNKSVLIWYSASQMFDLVTDVPSYPQFLPWCDQAKVLDADAPAATAANDSAPTSTPNAPTYVTAQVGISFGAVRQSFTTRNTHSVDAQGVHTVHLQLVKGPFSALQGAWRFTPVGSAAQNACRVELQLSYDFDSATLAALVGPVFDKIASSLVDAFVKRAEQVYGPTL